MSSIGSDNGWLEAAIAWEVCASLHRQYCKGKDALLTTRQSDFVKHAENARGRAAHGQAPAQAAEPVAWAPLTDEQIKALMQAHRTAMLMTCKARVPECGEFAAIAQDLDWLCESFGIKGGQHG